MSGLNLITLQENIFAYVSSQFPNYEIREDDIIDEEALVKANGKIKPYIVLRWGGLFRNTANANFAGVRFDEYISSVDIVVVAPTGSQARKGLNVVMDKLIGWKPNGSSPLTPFGGAGVYTINYLSGKPHVYAASGRLRFAVNGDNPGAHIQP